MKDKKEPCVGKSACLGLSRGALTHCCSVYQGQHDNLTKEGQPMMYQVPVLCCAGSLPLYSFLYRLSRLGVAIQSRKVTRVKRGIFQVYTTLFRNMITVWTSIFNSNGRYISEVNGMIPSSGCMLMNLPIAGVHSSNQDLI